MITLDDYSMSPWHYLEIVLQKTDVPLPELTLKNMSSSPKPYQFSRMSQLYIPASLQRISSVVREILCHPKSSCRCQLPLPTLMHVCGSQTKKKNTSPFAFIGSWVNSTHNLITFFFFFSDKNRYVVDTYWKTMTEVILQQTKKCLTLNLFLICRTL